MFINFDWIVFTLAKLWVKIFTKHPILTLIITAILFTSSLVGVYYLDKYDKEIQETKRLKSFDYKSQIQQLNITKSNIIQLLEFVESQSKTLQITEDTINSLKQEQEKLKPIVESQRSIVEAIFRAHEDRNSQNIWRERWIGFGFGILASLIASFIWYVINLLIKRRQNVAIESP